MPAVLKVILHLYSFPLPSAADTHVSGRMNCRFQGAFRAIKNTLWAACSPRVAGCRPLIQKLRLHLHYTSCYLCVASRNGLCRIGRSFILYRIASQQYGVTFISPTERSYFPSHMRSVSYRIDSA